MINKNDFEKAAKEFRAGRIVLKNFTDMIYGSLTSDSAAIQGAATTPQAADQQAQPKSIPAAKPSQPTTQTPQSDHQSTTQRSSPVHSTQNLDISAATPARLNIDQDRKNRCGWPEVIYGPGKTLQDLKQAAMKLLSQTQDVLITRLAPEYAKEICEAFPTAIWNEAAKTIRIPGRTDQKSSQPQDQVQSDSPSNAKIAILTAGTGDISIAQEAAETLFWMGQSPTSINDVGVAGPARLQRHIDFLQTCDVIIVVAGMEGALPSVVGGYVSCPVIAVPTSVGYGASFQGLAPLLGMLNSCAANVVAVNIDGGFKAGYLAGLIASRIARL